MDPVLKVKVQLRQQTPSAKTMNKVIACSAFELLVKKILQTSEGSES